MKGMSTKLFYQRAKIFFYLLIVLVIGGTLTGLYHYLVHELK